MSTSARQGRKSLTRELTEVMNGKQKLALAIMSHFRQPRGFAGWLVGWEMALRSSNRRRNVWAVGLLGVEPTDHVLKVGFGPGIAIRALSRRRRTASCAVSITRPSWCGRPRDATRRRYVRGGRVDLRLASAEQLPT